MKEQIEKPLKNTQKKGKNEFVCAGKFLELFKERIP